MPDCTVVDMEHRKLIERRYYDGKAREGVRAGLPGASEPVGAATVAPLLRAPYVEFERRVREQLRPGDVVLDVGAGTGIHSLVAAGAQRHVIGLDFSAQALLIARDRAAAHSAVLDVVCGDAEQLPIASRSVDLVTTAGILYCVDLTAFVREIRRVLRPHGVWILVGSFDHNPIYRFNRLVGYLRGRRTRRAVTNIPSTRTLARLRREFGRVEVSYHGVFSFLGPPLRRLLGDGKAAKLLDRFDRRTPGLREFAFKIVATLSGPISLE